MPSAIRTHDRPPTLGIEEEYLLLDRWSKYPAPVAEAVRDGAALLPALEPHEVRSELLQVQVEAATPVCQDLDEAGGHLLRLRHELSSAAGDQDALLVACGSAPWYDDAVPVTNEARYRDLRSAAPALVDEELINGMHVHVAVPSGAHGIEVMNRLRADLPLVVAMSANSPFWQGRDTGFASWRTVHDERWPVAGPPPHFADQAEHDSCVRELLATGSLRDVDQVTWQIRVSARYPTVEVRCADGQLRVDDALLIAGVVRALVMTALADMRHDVPCPRVRTAVLRAACWYAARHALDGELYDVRRRVCVPTAVLLAELLERVKPALDASHDADQIGKLAERLLREGCGATRQRAVVARSGLGRLVDFLAAETVATWPS